MTIADPRYHAAQGLTAKARGRVLAADRVPLTGVRIEVQARGLASAVTVSQRYVNREQVPVEAVYSFPLEEQAAVFGFEALIGERRVVGHVLEKDEAFEEYDNGMAVGHGAYLLDQDRPNHFTASIGNLLPGQQAIVTIKYVAKLERLGDQIRLKIPTTAAPRYIPREQLRQMDPAEFEHLNPPVLPGGMPYGLQLSVNFEGSSRVTAVECPSHPARVSTRGKTATVELSGPDVQLDQDMVVTFTLAEAGAAGLQAARDAEGDGILMLDLLPPREQGRTSIEAVFLIDRSGSMRGSSIAQARDALLLALSSLQKGDRFNVIGFGSRMDRAFPESVEYSDETLGQARAAVKGWDADLGGTEILRPLRRIVEAPAGDLPRRLLVLTDGEVANEAACLELVEAHPQTIVFTIGVGYGASDYLVRGLARAGRGQAEFVHPGERIESALLRQMARMTAVSLLEPTIDWGGLEPDRVAPATLPPLYPGTPFTAFARVPAAALARLAGSATAASGAAVADPAAAESAAAATSLHVTVTAKGADGPVRLSASAAVPAAAGGDDARAMARGSDDAIPRLFAREAIRDLEESQFTGEARGSGQRARRAARVKAAIVELSTRYSLMSSQTSFVAVEEREDGAGLELPPAQLRRVPVALLRDWHGTASRAALFAPAAPALYLRGASRLGLRAHCRLSDLEHLDDAPLLGYRPSPAFSESDAALAAPSSSSLVRLISGQRADGSWPVDDEQFEEFGVDAEALAELATRLKLAGAAPGIDPGAITDAAALATAVAVWLLRHLFWYDEAEWRLAADKAEAWLVNTLGSAHAQWLRDVVAAALSEFGIVEAARS